MASIGRRVPVSPGTRVHLVDGTCELFRHFFGQPPHAAEDGLEVGAVRGVLLSMLSLLGDGATHVGVATDHVIESFRNELWSGYKTGEGMEPALEEHSFKPGFALWRCWRGPARGRRST